MKTKRGRFLPITELQIHYIFKKKIRQRNVPNKDESAPHVPFAVVVVAASCGDDDVVDTASGGESGGCSVVAPCIAIFGVFKRKASQQEE